MYVGVRGGGEGGRGDTHSLTMNGPGEALGHWLHLLLPVPPGATLEPEIKGKISNTGPVFTVLMFLFIINFCMDFDFFK